MIEQRRSLNAVKLVAGIRLRRTSHDQSTTDLPRMEVEVEGDSFDICRALVDERVPEGWQVTWVRTG